MMEHSVALVVLVGILRSMVWCQYKLCSDPVQEPYLPMWEFHPTAEDMSKPDTDKMFNIPANMYTRQPILYFICNESDYAIEKKMHWSQRENITATIESIPAIDIYKDSYDGRLCQFQSDVNYLFHNPYAADPALMNHTCSTDSHPTTLNLTVRDNQVSVRHIMHTKTYHQMRKFRITLFQNWTEISSLETGQFRIYEEVHTVRWDEPTSFDITANQPFTLSLSIVDKDGNVIETGFGSTLYVVVGVAHYLKYFYHSGSRAGLLNETVAELAGHEVIVSEENADKVLMKRAVNGRVTFKDVRILDTTDNSLFQFKLNATLVVPNSTLTRYPYNYSDYIDCVILKQTAGYDDLKPRPSKIGYERPVHVYTYRSECNQERVGNLASLSKAFNVKSQVAAKLLLTENVTAKIEVTANFPIEGINYKILDEKGNRIHTGEDSAALVRVSTEPSGIRLSKDSDRPLARGRGSFMGSITEISARSKSMKLCFMAISTISKKTVPTVCTKTVISVTGEVHIAVFGDLTNSGSGTNMDPLIETFARFAAEDINEKLGEDLLPEIPVLSGHTLNVSGYDTKECLCQSTIAFNNLVRLGKHKPSKKIRAIIGFNSDHITYRMLALTKRAKIPIIKVKGIKREAHKNFVVQLSWSEDKIHRAFVQVIANRQWKNIILIRSEDALLSITFTKLLKEHNINIITEIAFPMFTGTKDTRNFFINDLIGPALTRIPGTKIKIIFIYVGPPLFYFVLREAIKQNLDSLHGYQWISLDLPGLAFPFSDEHPACRKSPTCAEAFEGTLIFVGAHSINYRKDLWLHTHLKFFEADRTLYRGIAKAREFHLASQYANGFDAVLALGHAIKKMSKDERTITTQRLVNALFRSKFEGLTEQVKFKNQQRSDFLAVLISSKYAPNGTFEDRHQLSRAIVMSGKDIVEILVTAEKMHPQRNFSLAKIDLPNTTHITKRKFKSYRGAMESTMQNYIPLKSNVKDIYPASLQATARSDETDLTDIILREEYVIQDFYCEEGCGGKMLSEYDPTNFTNGVCVGPNECRCKTVKELTPEAPEEFWENRAYGGDACDTVICQVCKNGICVGPEICLCHKGYTGIFCDEPMCSGGCGPGECIMPELCKCPGGYVGESCALILTIVLGPFILILLVMAMCCGALCVRWSRQRKWFRLMAATDWLVKWEEVICIGQIAMGSGDRRESFHFPLHMTPESIHNIVVWKDQKHYAQKFVSPSLNAGSLELRSEIVDAVKIQHINIIAISGVCVDSPNVAILTEFFPKGSLNDVLKSRKLPLDWDVKFSILKDIAKGMEYLHNSTIGSHGQLTSMNCLMDNRWCIRITGFGIPAIRSKPLETHSDEKPERLLWTAPELLRVHDTPHSVVPGTKAGDVYSFGIIISEVCNELEPFSLERRFLSVEEILLLLKNPTDPANRGLKITWDQFGGKDEYARPSVIPTSLPVQMQESLGLMMLMSSAWHEAPGKRPTFKEIVSKFQTIRRMKGELVDLLINRLEEYTQKLEADFSEASKELQLEKLRMEELLGRMLPKKIVEDMVHGKKIDAEEFDNATVGFSDIADFLHMSKFATPFQIIDLLNKLYANFDSIIDNFDVYKVETVRDEYMVVSGIPTRNGYQHAAEVATLALYLMSAMVNFEIPFECENKLLMLRVGIHSGPCVAGVVGLHMPRYCLFGDTVNTASRMKTSSSALRIHMSESTYNLLKLIGGFKTIFRGERIVKGKGKMLTYWLTGKDDFNERMPDLSQAVSSEVQEFK